MLADLIKKNRSYRRFYQNEPVSEKDLYDMIDAARLSPSARNAQSLCYQLSNTKELNDRIYPTLRWAGYLKDWDGPEEGERPSAYIIMMNNEKISTNFFCDHGIAAMSILLTAVEKGYGGCIIGAFEKKHLEEILHVPGHCSILHVIALGKPKETVVIEAVKEDQDIKYWRDEQGVHHVPKRALKDIIY
ncbi:MAG: nitroreductase family protein [Bacteroidales bacterium]|jgi:nitroreductase|nr:nitroreductase family protein [Bacteroidales bacterium]